MADQERERQREIARLVEEGVKAKLPDAVDRKIDEMPFYRRLQRTGWVGAGVLAAGMVGAGLLGLDQGTQGGRQSGAEDERERIFSRGVLLPELREKLTGGENLVVNVGGWTSASLRANGVEVPEFPVTFPDGEGNPETTSSSYGWFAIRPDGIYLPRGEDDTVQKLAAAIRTANTDAGKIDNRLGFIDGTYSDFIEAEIANLRENGQSLFQNGYVATSHRIEIDGVNTGFAIGRDTPSDSLRIITFDATPEALLPANISAGGIVVAK